MNNIFIFSDSIGVGQYIPPHLTWVNLFSKWVDLNYKNIMVQNASRNGDTTRLALERMPSDIQKYRPEYIIIQFGINDVNYWTTDEGEPRVSADAFQANLIEIIERVKRFGVKKIILNTNHITHYILQPNDVLGQTYNYMIRTVAEFYEDYKDDEEKEIIYLNDVEEWLGNKKILLEDGIHLNKLGHKLYFDNIIEFINRKLILKEECVR